MSDLPARETTADLAPGELAPGELAPGELAPLAELAALRPTASRRQTHESQVRRLLDAGLALLVEGGRGASPRVADVVAAAGLSNKAFYRYFASKDDLIAAIVDDGIRRIDSYLRHQMDKETSPEQRLRRLVGSYLGQATDPALSAATTAVLSHSASLRDVAGPASGHALEMLADLASGPVADLGSPQPDRDARIVAITLAGALEDLLWRRPASAVADARRVADFCLAGIRAASR